MRNKLLSLGAVLRTEALLPKLRSVLSYPHKGLTNRQSAEGRKRGDGVFETLRPASYRRQKATDLVYPAIRLPSKPVHGWQSPCAAHLCPYKDPADWLRPDKISTTGGYSACWPSHPEATPLPRKITTHFSNLPAAKLQEPVC